MDILFIYPAESEGFEPPIRRNAYTAFRVRLFRPLRQLSSFTIWSFTMYNLEKRVQRYCFFLTYASVCVFFLLFYLNFIKSGAKNASYISD